MRPSDEAVQADSKGATVVTELPERKHLARRAGNHSLCSPGFRSGSIFGANA